MRIAAAQLSPVWLDTKATTDKIVATIEKARGLEIELLAFPEAFLSGYPFWICRTNGAAFEDPRQKRAYARYLESSVEVESPYIEQIVNASRDFGVSVYLGISERNATYGRGSVYCSLLAIHHKKGLLGVHRKLMPTLDEKLCWAPGDGFGLKAYDFGGFKVGGLICGDNWMPVTRFTMFATGEDIHVSLWPSAPWVCTAAAAWIAHEGRVWSLAASGVLSMKDIPHDFEFYDDLKSQGLDQIFDGGSQIVSPRGEVVAAAKHGQEEIVWFDVDLQIIHEERQLYDVSGHYYRPDIFNLSVDRSRRVAVHDRDA